MDDDIVPISTAPPPISEHSIYQQSQNYQPPNQYQQPQHHSIQSTAMNNYQSNIIANSSSIGSSSNNNHNYHNTHNNHHQSQQLPILQSNSHQHGNEVGVLSSSETSSDSDSSGSGSDSDDNDKSNIKMHSNHMNNTLQSDSLPAHLLDEDLRLSESNSSDSDD